MKYLFTSILLSFAVSTIVQAQLIHPDAPEYYKVNATQLRGDDLPDIKYKAHFGTVWLKGGLKVSGKLKFIDIEEAIPQLEVKEKGSKKKYKVEFPMIKRIAMAGADDFTIRSDSTIFKWIEPLSGIFRQVQVGEIELYDNVYIVDEAFTIIPDYIPIAYNYYYDYILVEDVSDLSEVLSSNPYVSEMATVTGRGYSTDPQFINFLISLYNYPEITDNLGWSDMKISMKNGRILSGKGLAQPTAFSKNKKYPKYAVLHFKDDKGPRIIYHNEISSFSTNGIEYKSVWYRMLNVYAWAEEFRYENENYFVCRELKNENHYFFQNAIDSDDLIFLVPEKDKEGYKRAHVIPQVRKTYLRK